MNEDILLAVTLNNIILSETSKLGEITEENETYKVIPINKVIEYSKKLLDKKTSHIIKIFLDVQVLNMMKVPKIIWECLIVI